MKLYFWTDDVIIRAIITSSYFPFCGLSNSVFISAKKEPVKKEPKVKKETPTKKPKKEPKELSPAEKKKKKGKNAWETDSEDEDSDAMSADGFTSE